METTTFQLFVYGSLRSGFRNPAYQYIAGFFKLKGEALVKGKFYDKGKYPVAVHTEEDAFITGELYIANSADEFNWAIAQIDDYEGLNVELGEKPLYKRDLVQVFQDGQATTAWIYWYNETVEGLPELTTGDLLKYLQEKNKPQ